MQHFGQQHTFNNLQSQFPNQQYHAQGQFNQQGFNPHFPPQYNIPPQIGTIYHQPEQ